MATDAAIGKRRAQAVARIEQACEQLAGGQSLTLPVYSRHGQDTLLVLQLETIADYLESVNLPSSQPEPTTATKAAVKTRKGA